MKLSCGVNCHADVSLGGGEYGLFRKYMAGNK